MSNLEIPDVEIKRGYEVLPDNNIRFGIRIINNTDSAISDVEVILDYAESLFELDGNKIQKLDTIPPTVPRTAEFILKPLGCIHKEEIGATILYKDHEWIKHTEEMRTKKVHCVCPFLKQKNMSKSEFLGLSETGHMSETGLNFEGVSVEQIVSFLLQTCNGRYYKVDEVSVEGGKILYLASESIGEKAHYLLTAFIRENEGLTQVMLRAVSDKQHGLNGFLNEIVEEIRHIVSTVNSAHEIGIIRKEQVINIIDSVVQRTSFGGDKGTASVNIKDSVVQRSEFKGAEKHENLEKEKHKEKERSGVEKQEIIKKGDFGKGSGKKWASIAIAIVMLVAAFVPMISVAEYYKTTEIQLKTVEYQEQEPYTAQETYTEKEPYSDEEYTWRYPKNNIDWGNWGDGYYRNMDVVIENLENEPISLTIKVYFFDGSVTPHSNADNTELSQAADSVEKYISVIPYGTKTVNFQSDLPTTDYSVWGKRTQTVDQIQESKTVTKYRDITKYRDVIKYRTVTKTRQEPEQVQVTKTRMVKKTIFEYLIQS